MKQILRTKTQEAFDCEIERLIEKIKEEQPGTETYANMSKDLITLAEAREKKNPLQVDVNTLLAIGANVAGLLLVLYFEKTNIITSKAFGMIFKGRS